MDDHNEATVNVPEGLQQPTPPPSDSQVTGSTEETHIADRPQTKRMDIDEEASGPDMLSPMSTEAEKQDDSELPTLSSTDLGSPSMGYDFSNIRVCEPDLEVGAITD